MTKFAILCVLLMSCSLVLGVNLRARHAIRDDTDTVLLETQGAPDPCDGVCCGDYGHCDNGSCVCHETYVGEVCENRDACLNVDCGDHGECHVDNQDEYGNGDSRCYCEPGWIGENCETPNTECEGDFTEWGECSTTCEEGFQTRTYQVTTEQSGWGCECPNPDGLVETRDCFLRMCPIDCQGYWGEFGTCSQSCEEGTMTRDWVVTTEAQYGGQECPTTDTDTCNLGECPIDCEGRWSDYDECSTTCDEGFQTKTYIVDIPAQFNGKECEFGAGQKERRNCNDGYDDVCAIHCEGGWSGYDTCPVTCGGGTHSKTYSVNVEANHKGVNCPHYDGETESQTCNNDGCPVDCVGAWGAFSTCTETCGGGEQTQTFTVTTQSENGGASCLDIFGATDEEEKTQSCSTDPCPEHCEGRWGEFTECDVTCSTGEIKRTFSVSSAAAYGGLECEAADGDVETETCDAGPCPINCEGSYGGYDDCANDDMCGTGEHTRTFTVTVQERYGGETCDHPTGHEDSKSCELTPCPIDCEGTFGAWAPCSETCGDGYTSRDFIVSVPAAYGGKECPPSERDECNDGPCPVDCVGAWSGYGECSHSCGEDGTQERVFTHSVYAAHGGEDCLATDGQTESQPCNIWDCPDICHGVCCGDFGHCEEGTCVCYHGHYGPACEFSGK